MLNSIHRINLFRIAGIVLLILFVILLSLLLGQPRSSNRQGGWDFQAIWLGPYLLTQGENPYDTEIWREEHEKDNFAPQNDFFLYPLPFAVLLLPIGFLPLRIAAVVWVAVSLVMILFSVYLILKPHIRFKPAYLLPILTGVFLFRPVAVLIYILQFDAVVLLWVVAAWYLWLRGRWFLGGLVLALTVLKPQIGLPLLAFMAVWQVLRGRWIAILGVGAMLASLLVLGLAFDPAWIGRWLSIGGDKTAQNFYSTPTLWGLAAFACQTGLECAQWLGAALSVVTLLFVLWMILRQKQEDLTYVMCLAICGTLLISPYLWVYSQLLLILPLLMITIALYRLNWPYLVVATFPLVIALVSFALVGISILVGADMISALMPILIWLLLALLYDRDPKLLRAGW